VSWRHIEAAAKLELRSAVKFVLVAIAHHTNDYSGIAWPGLARLSRFTGLDRRSIQRCVKELEALGLMQIRRGTGTSSSVYTLTLPGEAAIDVTDDKTLPPEALGPGGGTESPPSKGGGTESPGGRQRVTPGAAQSHPNSNERERKTSDARDLLADDWQPKEVTVIQIKEREQLTDDEVEDQRRMFLLKNEGVAVPRPDAAFKMWCARVKDLKHPPRKPPAKKQADTRTPLEKARDMVKNLNGTIDLYRRMGKNYEVENECLPKLKRWQAELQKLEQQHRADA
jgi:DNA-binding MarR family transcriptional regulator